MKTHVGAVMKMAGTATALGVFVLGAAGSGPAGAAPGLPSPAGSYRATIINMAGHSRETLTVMADGRFDFVGISRGTWSETGDKVVLRGTDNGGDRYVFRIHQKGDNLGSKAREGTVTQAGFFAGSWYAVRSTAGPVAGG